MKDYVGSPLQIRGAEEYVLQNAGKGNGMRFLYLRNGLGLELWISLDRAGDVSRLSFEGLNMGYFGPCGYVAPQYYDGKGAGFLKSFTAGFFTTCGLTAVGSPCVDEGEELPLHGTLSHLPARLLATEEGEEGLEITLEVTEASLFGRKLKLKRTYTLSYRENRLELRDEITNEGNEASPYLILYHCNMGYPLLQEDSEIAIPHRQVTPRNAHAGEHLSRARQSEAPQADYEECCFYYDVKEKDGTAAVGIFHPTLQKGLSLSYDKKALPCFTQWKMMGKGEYVMGLEPGNCHPDGRDVMRAQGKLQLLQSGERVCNRLSFSFHGQKESFDSALKL